MPHDRRAYYQKNKEKIKAYAKAYEAAHKDQIKKSEQDVNEEEYKMTEEEKIIFALRWDAVMRSI